jgi:putative phosphoribosyl transferase
MRAQDEIEIPIPGATLMGVLEVPTDSRGIVVFAHGSGSSRHSVRNRMVAQYLRDGGFGTLLFDLLTADEERIDNVTAQLRFDVEFLARRLVSVTEWLVSARVSASALPLGYFGSSTGAAAALIADADSKHEIAAVVSRGGRPDLAWRALPAVTSPTLLLVGGLDGEVIDLNRQALARLQCEKRLVVIDGATHLFPEPGALELVCEHARLWFADHFV